MADQSTAHSTVATRTVEEKLALERIDADFRKRMANPEQERDKAALQKAFGPLFAVELGEGRITPAGACQGAKTLDLKLPPVCDKYLKPSSKK